MYLALYRKWRPATFNDVISQPHITTTLLNQLKTGKTAHAYLFTGSRGTGKTSCAKIFAKAINCENLQDGNPCLQCAICKSIEDGSATDVVEIDAASNNGVDDIRELRERAVFTPASCKYRVYIIDEVHMLSTSAFNALLKIMEEPPAHVKFILATTEVHKVPATILSRCQRFDFRRIKTEAMVELLLHVAGQEGIVLDPAAAELIARLADGAMRDAFSLLDQCIAAKTTDTVDASVVSAAAGVAGRAYLFELADAIADANSSQALLLVDKLHAMSKDLQRLCEELTAHFRSLMLMKAMPGGGGMLVYLPEEQPLLEAQSQRFSMGTILHCLTILQDCSDRLSRTAGKRTALEMCLIRLCTPSLNDDSETLLVRVEQLEASARMGGTVTTAPIAVQPQTLPHELQTPPPPVQAPPKRTKAVDPSKLTPVAQWADIMADLAKLSPAMKGVLDNSCAFEFEDMLFIDAPNGMFAPLLKRDGNVKLLGDCIRARLGKPYQIRLRKQEQAEPKAQNAPVDGFLDAARDTGADIYIK